LIETVLAKNGSAVLRKEGRLLASAVDPQAEAREWVMRRPILLTQVKSIFVLGVGSGYHVSELFFQTNATIVVVDRDQELVDSAREIQKFDSQRIHFQCVDAAKALRASDIVRSAVRESFLVLQHAASISHDAGFFNECEAQLLGRDWGHLNWQWQLKGHPALDSYPRIIASDEPLTIYDLESTELVQDSAERERMIIKALRELVK
jgi:hypothetical protein